MKKIFWLAAALLFIHWNQAFATTFDFSFTGDNNTIDITGVLQATPNGNGSFTVTSGTGVATVPGSSGVDIDLVANPHGTGPTNTAAVNGYYITYDNQLFPAAGPLSKIDNSGLLFQALQSPYNGSAGPTQINIFGGVNGPGTEYAYWESPANVQLNGTFTASDPSATPVPASLLLLAPGLAGLAVIRRRFKK